MSQPADLFNVRVHVVCACGGVAKFCVPVDKQIPKHLRCLLGPPSGSGAAGGAVRCPNGHVCGMGLSELRDRALRELERGRGRDNREEAIILECR